MTCAHELLGEVRNHAFRPAIHRWRNTLEERGDLSNAHADLKGAKRVPDPDDTGRASPIRGALPCRSRGLLTPVIQQRTTHARGRREPSRMIARSSAG